MLQKISISCWQCYGGNLSEKSSSVEEPEAASVGWGEQKLAPGSEVIDTELSGKRAGKVTTALGCHGMGVLRLEQAFKGSGTLTIEGQKGDVRVEAIIPQWWPAEWFQVHQQNTAAA